MAANVLRVACYGLLRFDNQQLTNWRLAICDSDGNDDDDEDDEESKTKENRLLCFEQLSHLSLSSHSLQSRTRGGVLCVCCVERVGQFVFEIVHSVVAKRDQERPSGLRSARGTIQSISVIQPFAAQNAPKSLMVFRPVKFKCALRSSDKSLSQIAFHVGLN